MKILYLTRVDIGSSAAQAHQIRCMAKAFGEHLNDNFLIMSGAYNQVYKFPHRSIPFARYQELRYLGACIIALKRTILRKDDAVITRDIVIASLVVACGGCAIYEAHKDPRSSLAHYLFKLLAKIKRFRMVLISEALNQYYQNKYSISDKRCLTAHDGVFTEEYSKLLREKSKQDLRSELGLTSGKYIIVHTGSLYKGGVELFSPIINSKYDIFFVHVGGAEWECNKWRSYFSSSGRDNFMFLPYLERGSVIKYQLAADALLYMTTKENSMYWCTSPLKVFEYMATGNPIIASRLGSVNEVLNDSNSYGFDPSHEETLTKLLELVISDVDKGKELATSAHDLVQDKYSWGIRVKNILKFISKRKIN